MKRYAFRVAYIGWIDNKIAGFQEQTDQETVYSVLMRAFLENGYEPQFSGKRGFAFAGRTDRGVSAIEQTISCDFFEEIEDRFLVAVNKSLPEWCRIWACSEVSEDFHPRFDALYRQYVYYSYIEPDTFDVREVHKSMSLLVGRHNFYMFSKRSDNPMEHYQRHLYYIGLEQLSFGLYRWTFRGNAFLRQQVRRMVSHLVQVGKKESDFRQTYNLLMQQASQKPASADPHFLVLEHVHYGNKVKWIYLGRKIKKWLIRLRKMYIETLLKAYLCNHFDEDLDERIIK